MGVRQGEQYGSFRCRDICSITSAKADQNFRLRIAAKALRTVDKLGGLDAYLAKAKDEKLSEKALKIKRDIAKKAEGVEA